MGAGGLNTNHRLLFKASNHTTRRSGRPDATISDRCLSVCGPYTVNYCVLIASSIISPLLPLGRLHRKVHSGTPFRDLRDLEALPLFPSRVSSHLQVLSCGVGELERKQRHGI